MACGPKSYTGAAVDPRYNSALLALWVIRHCTDQLAFFSSRLFSSDSETDPTQQVIRRSVVGPALTLHLVGIDRPSKNFVEVL